MTKKRVETLERALLRERAARQEAERILEQKSLELYKLTINLEETNKNLTKVLGEKTEQLESLFDSIIDAYILIDLKGNVLKMNNEALRFFGYDINKEPFNVLNIIYEGDYDYAMASFETLISTGSFRNYQARVYTKSREVKWVQINSSIIHDVDGQPVFAQGIVRDITQARIDAENFENQKEELSYIFDNSKIGIVLTQYGKIIKSNAAVQHSLGYSNEELLKMTVRDVTFVDDEEKSMNLIDRLNKGEINNFTINKRYLTKKGKTIWAKTNVSGVHNEDGEIKYLVALIEDVTEEFKKGRMLKALNSLMSSILGKTTIYEIAWEITEKTTRLLGLEDCVIYLRDNKNNVLNQIAAYGAKVDEDKRILNKVSLPLGKGIVGSVGLSGKAEVIKDTSKDPRYVVDDKFRYSEIAVPIIADGEIIGVIDSEHEEKNYFTRDHLHALRTIAGLAATQLKNALNIELKREAELEKEKVLLDLKRSNEELNDFAHVVSHDLKSPLRSINALVTWLQEDCEGYANESVQSHFEMLLKKVDKMDHLINGILKYAGIDKGNHIRKDVDINQVLKVVMDTIHVPEHINISFEGAFPILKGEKFKFQQLFQNLISNAVKFIDKPEGRVLVKCKEEKNAWLFSVEDNGIGISKRFFKKIFTVFQVLEESEDSTGVGLSIVKKIVHFYRGKVWLESEVGQGTTFYFTIPK